MKRLIALLLALALLLGGCVRPADPSTPFSDLLAPDHLPEPPADSPYAPLQPSNVRVDESAYTPRPTVRAKFTRPADDLSVFIPGLGPADPYRAGENQYGFCAPDGTLLSDPIYERIVPVTNYDYRNPAGYEMMPFWEVIPHTDDPDGPVLRGAVAMDGSFATDCCYWGIRAAGEGIACFRTYGSDFDLFDGSGRPLLTDLERDRFGDDDDYWTVELRDGLILLSVYGDDAAGSWFFDLDGNLVLGPYDGATHFSEGLACVSADGEHYGYIDRTGKWVLEPVYSGGESFRDGRAIQFLDDRSVLIDRAGTVLLDAPPDSLDEMFGVYRVLRNEYAGGDWAKTTTEFYDRDGNPLFSGSGLWLFADADTVYCVDSQGINVQSLRHPDRQLYYETFDYPNLYPGVLRVGDGITHGFEITSYSDMRRIWIDGDLSAVRELPLYQRPQMLDTMYPYEVFYDVDTDIYDQRTGEKYHRIYEKDRIAVFSDDGARFWTCPVGSEVSVAGGRLGVATDRDFTYYEADGSVSFRFPYFVTPSD